MSDRLAAARWYAERLGFCVLPGRGRVPHVQWKLMSAEPTDPAQIERWWRRWPDADVCWLVGDRFAGIDVDVRDTYDGRDELHDLERAHRFLPDTPRALTPRDGVHIVFSSPSGVTVPAGDLAPGVDLRTGRRIIALPPSQGRQWEVGPHEVAIAELPDWVIALAQAKAAESNGHGCGEHQPPAGRVPHGQRHPYLRDFVVRLLRAGITDRDSIEAHLRLQFEIACAPDPPPTPGYFQSIARWAAATDIAERERFVARITSRGAVR